MLVFVDAVLKRLVVVIAKPVCHYDREGELLHQITVTMVWYIIKEYVLEGSSQSQGT